MNREEAERLDLELFVDDPETWHCLVLRELNPHLAERYDEQDRLVADNSERGVVVTSGPAEWQEIDDWISLP